MLPATHGASEAARLAIANSGMVMAVGKTILYRLYKPLLLRRKPNLGEEFEPLRFLGTPVAAPESKEIVCVFRSVPQPGPWPVKPAAGELAVMNEARNGSVSFGDRHLPRFIRGRAPGVQVSFSA
jgi:hypothetical protein